jgi:hypothetical protein
MKSLYTVEDRDRVRRQLIEKAEADPRIVGGAEIGALAKGTSDRWSDLDLTFALAEGISVDEVLTDWTADMARDLDAAHLFDLPVPPTVYRVFLLPSNLQIDLSFTPGTEIIGRGSKHTVLFGRIDERDPRPPRSVEDIFGWAVHHALRSRFSIERERWWQAEFWIGELRDHALMLACRRRGLDGSYGRGFDDLPADVLDVAKGALVGSLDRAELMRALYAGIDLLLEESGDVAELATKLEPQLRELAAE